MTAAFLSMLIASFNAAVNPPVVTLKPERLAELMKKLEQPTRQETNLDPKDGPPEGSPPKFNYRFHREAHWPIIRAGNPAKAPVLALLQDETKPAQARGRAGAICAEWVFDKGGKYLVDPRMLKAVKDGLKNGPPEVKWAIVHQCYYHGLADARIRMAALSHHDPKDTPPGGWPTPEDLSFSPAMMDELLPGIIALLKEDEPELVQTACSTIHSFGQPDQGVAELIRATRHKDKQTRACAAMALGRVGSKDATALTAILDLAKPEENDPATYGMVLRAVGEFGPKAKAAVPLLIKAIDEVFLNRDPATFSLRCRCAEAAIDSLGKIGPDAKVAVPLLIKYVEENHGWIKHVEAIEKIDVEGGKIARAYVDRKMAEFREQSIRRLTEQQGLIPEIPTPLPPPYEKK